MCAAAILPAGLTRTNLGHAAFYRIRRPLLGDAVAPSIGAGCDLIGACPTGSHRSTVRRLQVGECEARAGFWSERRAMDLPIHTGEETLVTLGVDTHADTHVAVALDGLVR